MEFKLAREGTAYILGLPLPSQGWLSYITTDEAVSLDSLEEARKARDKLSRQVGKPLAIYEVVFRLVE